MSAVSDLNNLFSGYSITPLSDGSYLVGDFALLEVGEHTFRLELHHSKKKFVQKLLKEYGSDSKNFLAGSYGAASKEYRNGAGTGQHPIKRAVKATEDYKTIFAGNDFLPTLLEKIKEKYQK